MVSLDARSRRRLNRCGAGAAFGSIGTIDARRKREEESVLLRLLSFFLGVDEERMLSKWKGSSSSLSVGGENRRSRLRDFLCFKELGLLPLDAYFSGLSDEFISGGFLLGGCERNMTWWAS
jgi:hypothetical protein